MKTGFIPMVESRLDHEVEMARSDLFSAAKNAKQVYELIADSSEEEGLEGWVQEKIIKANDYLNTIREYLEGKELQQQEMIRWRYCRWWRRLMRDIINLLEAVEKGCPRANTRYRFKFKK
jgi:hypothetical protein